MNENGIDADERAADLTGDPDHRSPVDAATTADATTTKRRRILLFTALAAGTLVVGGGYYAYDELVASRHVFTDNAYVGADVAQVTSQVSGPVAAVLVADTRSVRRGDVLVRIDDSDARLALARAEANLGMAIRKIRGVIATDDGLSAQIAARVADEARSRADVASALGDFDRARIDLDRRRKLAASGSVSGEELTTAQNAYATARAKLEASRAGRALATANRASATGTRDANSALIRDAGVDDNPEVLAARAARDQAKLDLDRTVVRAPIDGVVSRRQVQVGQRIQAGMMLMAVVPISVAYVDANFKEVQLAKVRPGQPVKLEADLYGDSFEYHGRVVGFSGGTGAAFAVVPAQNATGNWIKVVQRLPVRIAIDPAHLRSHPLRVGLSMTADIDIAN